jgi:hypothetical protein
MPRILNDPTQAFCRRNEFRHTLLERDEKGDKLTGNKPVEKVNGGGYIFRRATS